MRTFVMMAAVVALAGTMGLAQGRQGGAGPGGGGQPQGRQGGQGRQAGVESGGPNLDNVEIKSLRVQGNVWMLVGGFVNAAVQIGEIGRASCRERV